MNEREQSIISQVEIQRRAQEKERQSVEEAREQLLGIRQRLQALFQKNAPVPEEKKSRFMSDLNDNDYDKYKTYLAVSIPSETGAIKVHISATHFPYPQTQYEMKLEDEKKQESILKRMSGIHYRINVEELDYTVTIDANKATLESKTRDSAAPKDPMHVRIGYRYPSWPVWKRDANMDDIARYSDLLSYIENEPCEIEGESNPLYSLDFGSIFPQNRTS